MKHASKQTYGQFYENLAFLFYAVAAADGEVRKEEKAMLHRMVIEDWLSLENSSDSYGTDAAYEIEVIFDRLDSEGTSSDKAFKIFETFFHENSDLFDEDVISKIFHTSHRIASAFSQKNKAEHVILVRIHFLLGHANAAH